MFEEERGREKLKDYPFLKKSLRLLASLKIVKEHLGSIHLESRISEGTTFYVNFPLDPVCMRLKKRNKKKDPVYGEAISN